jgi:hypothetical protein
VLPYQGLDSGGIDDETYAAYDKPWRPNDTIQKSIYRPTKEVDARSVGFGFWKFYFFI